jgi:hypothetical protein
MLQLAGPARLAANALAVSLLLLLLLWCAQAPC